MKTITIENNAEWGNYNWIKKILLQQSKIGVWTSGLSTLLMLLSGEIQSIGLLMAIILGGFGGLVLWSERQWRKQNT